MMMNQTAPMQWGDRRKPPRDRHGRTYKIPFGKSAIYATINHWDDGDRGICEIFAKADSGLQGQADELCETGSLALQYGCPAETLVRHWYGHADEPWGAVGKPKGLSDALAFALAAETGIELGRHVACEVANGASIPSGKEEARRTRHQAIAAVPRRAPDRGEGIS